MQQTTATRVEKQVVGKLTDDMIAKTKEMIRENAELAAHMKKAEIMAMELEIKRMKFWSSLREELNLREEPNLILDESTNEVIAVPEGYRKYQTDPETQ